MIQPQNLPKISRLGCVARFWLAMGLACRFLLAFQALFMPWGFYLGGHFHTFPEWSAWAPRMRRMARAVGRPIEIRMIDARRRFSVLSDEVHEP
jgi:hypothetical protein